MKKTTCPLDCYDACGVIYEDEKLKGDLSHPFSQGTLCSNLNAFLKTPKIIKPTLNGKEISLDEALVILVAELKKSSNSLYFKSQGNFGVMQNITKEFFSQFGSTFTRGSLCDSIGEAGVIAGRGESLVLPLKEIKKSEVVVVWGRNIDTTNEHIYNFIKDKTLIVIDPVKTKIAKQANLHIQIKPHKDIYLAILLARFVLIEMIEDEKFIEDRCENYDYFLDFINSFRINKLISDVGMSIDELNFFISNFIDKRVVFLVGVGVQKYKNGDNVLHMIDSLASMLGLFAKEGCGVSYLANSSFGFKLPFKNSSKTTPIVNVDFSKYDLTFIQGANPANQMPNSKRVIEGLKSSNFSVYFGLYENETSSLVNLVIPAKSFLAKSDLRFSYGHEYIGKMPKLIDEENGISEYELTSFLIKEFGYEKLDTEDRIIKNIIDQNTNIKDDYLSNATYEKLPYKEKFYTDDEKFIFIDEFEKEDEEDGLYLITSKAKHSLNSQFKRSKYLYLHSNLSFCDGDIVIVSSKIGSYEFEVRVDDDIRDDCVLIYSGTKGVNYITTDSLSYEGEGAIYQQERVKLEKLK